MADLIPLVVPDIGDYRAVPVIEILVAPGQRVDLDAPLVTLESDKATMDVPAAQTGIVRELRVQPGDRVSAGDLLALLEPDVCRPSPPGERGDGGEGATAQHRTEQTLVPAAAPLPAPDNGSGSTAPNTHFRCGPAVRKLARELGVNLAEVRGTGPRQRLLKEDVKRHVQERLALPVTPVQPAPWAPWPSVDFARFGPVERWPRARLQQVGAANLARNWALIPHVTSFDEADVTELDAFRRRLNDERGAAGPRLTLLSFVIKAAVCALKAYPTLNASLDGDVLVEKRYWHIGFAVDTPNGLLVPVVRDVDRKGLLDLAEEIARLATQARQGKLTAEQMQGGSFTVSSLGGVGGTGFTPIINAPEVAVLGIAPAALKPVWGGGQFQPRLMLPLCLSWDHRAIDGVEAARFNRHLASVLGDFRRALL